MLSSSKPVVEGGTGRQGPGLVHPGDPGSLRGVTRVETRPLGPGVDGRKQERLTAYGGSHVHPPKASGHSVLHGPSARKSGVQAFGLHRVAILQLVATDVNGRVLFRTCAKRACPRSHSCLVTFVSGPVMGPLASGPTGLCPPVGRPCRCVRACPADQVAGKTHYLIDAGERALVRAAARRRRASTRRAPSASAVERGGVGDRQRCRRWACRAPRLWHVRRTGPRRADPKFRPVNGTRVSRISL
ncbi:hypothetical protein SAMN05428941_6853 [Streptomyces sp. 2114.2]|nr:hypothetical protein BX268_6867 [Streptomyces sp. 2221.1]SDT79862.1 hypothetical protein SAMN05428941_6853 [Streptomyces sp. 2114.2]